MGDETGNYSDEAATVQNMSFEERKAWLFEQTGYSATPNLLEAGAPVDMAKLNAVLNDALDLGHDARLLAALSLIDEGLAQITRFADTMYLAGIGDSVAAHHMQCQLLVHDIFQNAGALESEKELYRNTQAAIGAHDTGEIMGEASTVSSRANQGDHSDNGEGPVDKEAIERRITRFALTLADYANQKGQPELFRAAIAEIIAKTNIAERGEDGLFEVPPLLEAYEVRYGLKNHALTPELEHYLECYTEAETEEKPSFMRAVVKNVERMQGTRYFMRERDDLPENAVPLTYSISNHNVASLKRLERGLDEMYEVAQTPGEKAIAKEVAKKAYESALEFLDKVPPILDRAAGKDDEPVPEVKADAEASAQNFHVKRLETVRGDYARVGDADNRRDVETVARLKTLYKAALIGVERGTYEPREMIVNSDKVPEGLRAHLVEAVNEMKAEHRASLAR